MISRTTTRLFFAACLLFPLLLPGQKAPGLEQEKDLLRKYHSTLAAANRGLELVAARQWAEAERQFLQALETLPENPNACYGMACVCNQRGETVAALAWIERAEQGCRVLQLAWKNREANPLLLSREEQQRLNELAAQSVGGDPSLGGCHAQLRANESKVIGKATVNPLPDESSPFAIPAEFLVLHGNLLFKKKLLAEAETKYLEALAVAPAHERGLNNLINLYWITRRLDRACQLLDQAVRLKVKIHPGLEKAVRRAGQGG